MHHGVLTALHRVQLCMQYLLIIILSFKMFTIVDSIDCAVDVYDASLNC